LYKETIYRDFSSVAALVEGLLPSYSAISVYYIKQLLRHTLHLLINIFLLYTILSLYSKLLYSLYILIRVLAYVLLYRTLSVFNKC
jgi:hypothetical protein